MANHDEIKRAQLGSVAFMRGMLAVAVAFGTANCSVQYKITEIPSGSSIGGSGSTFSITPQFGPIGSIVTLSNQNFTSASNFSVNGTSGIVLSQSSTEMKAFVMPSSTSGYIAALLGVTAYGSANPFTITTSGVPVTQQGAKLVGSGPTGAANQGSVGLSADGNTLAVGGYSDNSSAGATWIFTRTGTSWTQQGAKLIGTGASGPAQQGVSVSLSADGNTLAVGGLGDVTNIGATWIFTRTGTTWTQQGAKLVGTGAIGASTQGVMVSLSADGNTLAVGGQADNSNVGAIWIFTRTGTTWSQQGAKLIGTGATGAAYQGYSVSLSANGNTLAAGGVGDNSGAGATWIFTRSGSTWTQQGSKLVGTGATGAALQGASVSLSADGNTLAAGGYLDNTNAGATWIFTRSGSTWTQQGAKLVGTGATGNAQQGISVSLSADGNSLAIGGYEDNTGAGATWFFTRSGSTWTQQGTKLVGTGASGAANQGVRVKLSSDGNTLAIGGAADSSGAGATWIFAP